MIKYLLIFCMCCLFTARVFSQDKYAHADRVAASAKATSIEGLHKELTGELGTDEEKLRSFYFWITHHINYDVNEWMNPSSNIAKQHPANVLKSRKAVCHGYSQLFKSFCDLSGIKCLLVSGYIKRDGAFVGEGHTWNIVFVNDKWLPVDVTWGAGGVDASKRFVKEFDQKYFLADPVVFMKDHYSFDPALQLVSAPVALGEYKKKDWKYSDAQQRNNYDYNDTIAEWMKNDSITMRLLSAERMVRNNPGDTESRKELSYAMLDFAQQETLKGTAILSELYPESKNKQTTASAINLPPREFNIRLDAAYMHFSKADSVLNKIAVTGQRDRTDVENMRKVLRHNMNVIEGERRK